MPRLLNTTSHCFWLNQFRGLHRFFENDYTDLREGNRNIIGEITKTQSVKSQIKKYV
jgi:hypothetical protein